MVLARLLLIIYLQIYLTLVSHWCCLLRQFASLSAVYPHLHSLNNDFLTFLAFVSVSLSNDLLIFLGLESVSLNNDLLIFLEFAFTSSSLMIPIDTVG